MVLVLFFFSFAYDRAGVVVGRNLSDAPGQSARALVYPRRWVRQSTSKLGNRDQVFVGNCPPQFGVAKDMVLHVRWCSPTGSFGEGGGEQSERWAVLLVVEF